MTPSRDILLFLVSNGEERAAEDQQNVISALENAKLKSLLHAKQTTLHACLK